MGDLDLKPTENDCHSIAFTHQEQNVGKLPESLCGRFLEAERRRSGDYREAIEGSKISIAPGLRQGWGEPARSRDLFT